MLTFLEVGFWGNLVQGFRVYAWRAVPSFPQIALCFPSFALRPQPFQFHFRFKFKFQLDLRNTTDQLRVGGKQVEGRCQWLKHLMMLIILIMMIDSKEEMLKLKKIIMMMMYSLWCKILLSSRSARHHRWLAPSRACQSIFSSPGHFNNFNFVFLLIVQIS